MRRRWAWTATLILAAGLACAARGSGASESAGPGARWEHAERLLGAWHEASTVAFVDDPRLVVLGDRHGRVSVWDIEAGSQQLALPRRSDPIRAVTADAAGRRVAVGVRDGVTVWDTATARRTHSYAAYEIGPKSMAMSRNGAVLAATTGRLQVTVWNARTGAVIRVVSHVKAHARAVSVDGKGKRLAVGWSNGTVEVHDVRTGARIMHAAGHTATVEAAHLTPDGSRLVTGGADARAKVWDVATGALVGMYGSSYRIGVTAVRVSNSGSRILVAPGGGGAHMWNVETGKRVRGYGRKGLRIRQLALSPDGRRLAGVGGGAYALWATGTGKPAPTAQSHSRRAPDHVQLSADGARALTFYGRYFAAVYDTATGEELRAFGDPETAERGFMTIRCGIGPGPSFLGAAARFVGVRMLGDGRRVLDFRHLSGGIVVRDIATGGVARTFNADPPAYEPYILSPDHGLLLTGGEYQDAHVWDVAAGKRLYTLVGLDEPVASASFDAANETLVTSDWGGAIRLWDAATGQSSGVVPSTAAGAHAVSLSPDGRYLLVSRGSQYVGDENRAAPPESHVWDLATLTDVTVSPDEWARGSAWSGDSQFVYTLGGDGQEPTVEVWSPRAFGRLPDISMPDAWVRPAARSTSRPAATPLTQNGPHPGGRAAASTMQGISRMSLSADGSTFAYINDAGSIDIWRRAPGVRRMTDSEGGPW